MEAWCVEFSELLLAAKKHPFHVDKINKVIGLNNWSMLTGKHNGMWMTVFVSDNEHDCHRYVQMAIDQMIKKHRMS